MKIRYVFAVTLLVVLSGARCQKVISIGGILANDNHKEMFMNVVGNLTAPPGYTYQGIAIVIGSNPVVTANDICSTLLPNRVVTVVFDVLPEMDRFMSSVPYTMEFYKIPVVGISSQSSVLSNTYAHPQFMRTLPPHSFQSGLWFNTLKVLDYNKVIVIYTNDVEGETTLDKFRNMILQSDTAYGERSLEISKLIMLQPYETDLMSNLMPIQNEDSRVILLAAGSDIAGYVYDAATKLGLVGSSWVWIVSGQAANVSNLPQGTLRWRPMEEATSIKSNMQDALRVINEGITEYLSNNTDLGDVPESCSSQVLKSPDSIPFWNNWEKGWWQPGIDLYDLYKSKMIRDGDTGVVSFIENGDRRSINYDLVNSMANNTEQIVGNFSTSYNYTASMIDYSLAIDVEAIEWPGYPETKPQGVNISMHLRVVTIEEIPFVYTLPLDVSDGCNDTQLYNPSAIAKMKCPKTLENGGVLEFCCYGYLIDMLDMLRINMSVTFDLHLVADDLYGSQHVVANSTGKAQWTGMMGELLGGKADMIVAPFVINPERAKYVDFTKPFKFLGITILVKKNAQKSSLDSFLQPFEDTLWFLVVVSVHVIALVLYLLDRFSPFGQLQLARETDSEDALSLSTAIWFAWGVLLNSGIGEGTPKSFSARVLGMVWAGFAMIIVASYTANLAAFLVLDKPEASISGIDDPRLRNPTDNFKFATVKDSAIEEYFKRQVEFTTMFRTMENYNKDNVEEAIDAVESGELNAFIWDSPRLIYEATKECDLVTAGELFGRSSYGIAFKKNSHWTDKFSLKILSYHEVGKMEMYDNKWIMNATECDSNTSSPATLGLANMAGVFIMVATGIGIGFVILLIEIGYSKYETMKEKQNTIAKKAISRWKRYVQRRKALRKTWALIKDINETDSISDDERRRRIRDYLESPGADSRSASPQPNHNNGTVAVGNGRHRASIVTSANWLNGSTLETENREGNSESKEPPTSHQHTTSPPASSVQLPAYLYNDGSVKHNPVFVNNI